MKLSLRRKTIVNTHCMSLNTDNNRRLFTHIIEWNNKGIPLQADLDDLYTFISTIESNKFLNGDSK